MVKMAESGITLTSFGIRERSFSIDSLVVLENMDSVIYKSATL